MTLSCKFCRTATYCISEDTQATLIKAHIIFNFGMHLILEWKNSLIYSLRSLHLKIHFTLKYLLTNTVLKMGPLLVASAVTVYDASSSWFRTLVSDGSNALNLQQRSIHFSMLDHNLRTA